MGRGAGSRTRYPGVRFRRHGAAEGHLVRDVLRVALRGGLHVPVRGEDEPEPEPHRVDKMIDYMQHEGFFTENGNPIQVWVVGLKRKKDE